MTKTRHTLLHLDDGLKRAVDPKEVFLLEADGDDTLVRLWQSSALRDRRNLDEVLRTFEPFGFLRLHSVSTTAPAASACALTARAR